MMTPAIEAENNRRLRLATRELLREMHRAIELGWGFPPKLTQAQEKVNHLLELWD